MDSRLLDRATEYTKKRNRNKRWKKLVSLLAAIVVFSTTYALILPAITMESDTYCGLEEHVHTEECYETIMVQTEDCYELICDPEEAEGHIHDEDCYELIPGELIEQKVLVCDLEEHTHTDICYINPQGPLGGEPAEEEAADEEATEEEAAGEEAEDSGIYEIVGFTEDGVVVIIKASRDSLPVAGDELSLTAERLFYIEDLEEDDEEGLRINTAIDILKETWAEEEIEPENNWVFDIRLWHDGEEIQPIGPVELVFTDLDSYLDRDRIEKVLVHHLDEKGKIAQDMPSKLKRDGSLVVETDHFSIYSVSLLVGPEPQMGILAEGNGETVDIAIEKIWTGGSPEVASIDIDIYANDIYVDTVTLKATDGWATIEEGYPAEDNNGNPIEYSIEEINLPSGWELDDVDVIYQEGEEGGKVWETVSITGVQNFVNGTTYRFINGNNALGLSSNNNYAPVSINSSSEAQEWKFEKSNQYTRFRNVQYTNTAWNIGAFYHVGGGRVELSKDNSSSWFRVTDTSVTTNSSSGTTLTVQRLVSGGSGGQSSPAQYGFTITNKKVSTSDGQEESILLIVKNQWASTCTPSESMTFKVIADGVDTGERIIVRGDEDWQASKEMPRKNSEGGPITYSLALESDEGIDGLVSEITEGIVETTESWISSNSLENGASYRFLTGNNKQYALGMVQDSSATQQDGWAYRRQNKDGASLYQHWTWTSGSGTSGSLKNQGSGSVRTIYDHDFVGDGKIKLSGQATNGWFRYSNSSYSSIYYISFGNLSGAATFDLEKLQIHAEQEFTVTNTCASGDGSGVNLSILFENNKRIDYLGDGVTNPHTNMSGSNLYRLYLDAKPASHPVDLVLVVDRSFSMKETVNGKARDVIVRDMLNGVNGQTGFINNFLSSNDENNLSIVWFGGRYISGNSGRTYVHSEDAGTVKTWTKDKNYKVKVTTNNSTDGVAHGNVNDSDSIARLYHGTNYMAGFWQAVDMLKENVIADNGHIKMVVFLTDGLPTYSVSKGSGSSANALATATYAEYKNGNPIYRRGDGQSVGTMNGTRSLEAFQDFKANNEKVVFSTLLLGAEVVGNTSFPQVSQLHNNGGGVFEIDDGDEARLNEIFQEVVTDLVSARELSIVDNLSPYVEYYGTKPDIMVHRENIKTGIEELIWQNGAAVSGFQHIVDSVTYTPSGASDSTGSVELKFKDDYNVNLEYKYTLSFNVKLNDLAYDEYGYNINQGDSTGYGGIKGNPDTDFTGNITSSNQAGFRSNKNAYLKYKSGSSNTTSTQSYDHPVVQVKGVQVKFVKIAGTKGLAQAYFILYKEANESQEGAEAIPGHDGAYGIDMFTLTSGQDGVFFTGSLQDGKYYLVEIEAPEGFYILETAVEFELENGNLTLTPHAKAELQSQGDYIELKITNDPGYLLPETGGMGTRLFIIVGTLLMLGAGLIYIYRLLRRGGRYLQ